MKIDEVATSKYSRNGNKIRDAMTLQPVLGLVWIGASSCILPSTASTPLSMLEMSAELRSMASTPGAVAGLELVVLVWTPPNRALLRVLEPLSIGLARG
eukprot:6342805-Prymnesium_polylepis.1